ncbi:ribokinase [Polycladidibacter stylochi]|uniref:ribokinase n=1 Tax=Polycladidibacter stylochi TaxID=1807766 RepID=UPI000835E54E|nr:ribokinase [Pseudovibrio stylochi]
MIVVFGSINLDLVVRVDKLPRAGETVSGPDLQHFAGGKGANQALAARRAGAKVKLVGAVGTDAFAKPALANLETAGVDIANVATVRGATGTAMIGVDQHGENQIIVASGANQAVRSSQLKGQLQAGDTLLLQLELPMETIHRALSLAHKAEMRTIMNIAPFKSECLASMLPLVDIIVANESEAAALAQTLGYEKPLEELVHELFTKGIQLVVTLGEKGCIAMVENELLRVPSPHINPIDTTGAGDSFVGGLAAALDAGATFEQALRQASAAGALACTKQGAQTSAPDQQEILCLASQLT